MATYMCRVCRGLRNTLIRKPWNWTEVSPKAFTVVYLQSRHYADSSVSYEDKSWLKKILHGSGPAADVDLPQSEVDAGEYMAIPTVEEKPFVIKSPQSLKRAYRPPDNLMEQMESISKKLCPDSEDWRTVSLLDSTLKYKVLTACQETLHHTPTNYQLNELQTINDVITFYQTEVKDTNKFDELSQQDLPKNLKINWE
ncbi:large ribosomal subunit protein mL50-like [Saccoglossus kowalevskii]|uniref:Large ribosomal subunit protein mL50 n=1 Tax=Saccoglossus kowalevskii TaxID=10224 RepID=A0ABM0GY29_SACKO|nr:PREDICTED: 39S ribosomal protein L50, mitochondrial-like [Saccoglossus kowalevskii]